jgi:hypothetical protein
LLEKDQYTTTGHRLVYIIIVVVVVATAADDLEYIHPTPAEHEGTTGARGDVHDQGPRAAMKLARYPRALEFYAKRERVKTDVLKEKARRGADHPPTERAELSRDEELGSGRYHDIFQNKHVEGL